MATEEKIIALLENEFGLDTNGLGRDDALFSSGILDSLSSLRLLMSLEGHFGVTVSPLDVTLEDVDTVSKIAETIQRLQG